MIYSSICAHVFDFEFNLYFVHTHTETGLLAIFKYSFGLAGSSSWFLPCEAMLSAVYAVVVCLCVCLSHSGIVSKRLNVGSCKQRRTIAHDSSFLTPKITAKFERDHPLRGRQMQVGWVKIGQFRRKTRYNSKTVQDRSIVSIKVE